MSGLTEFEMNVNKFREIFYDTQEDLVGLSDSPRYDEKGKLFYIEFYDNVMDQSYIFEENCAYIYIRANYSMTQKKFTDFETFLQYFLHYDDIQKLY